MKTFFLFSIFAIAITLTMGQISIAHGVDISATIPSNGSITDTSSPGGYINSFYQFALLIGGVLALAVVVYGGISYMTSVGNPSGQTEARAWLEAALFGVLLLAGAYLILKIINPQLVNVALPTLQDTGATTNQVTVTANTNSQSSGNGGGSSATPAAPTANTPPQSSGSNGGSGAAPATPAPSLPIGD